MEACGSGTPESPWSATLGDQDGRSATITAPSGPAQQRALQNSLRDSELQLEGIQSHRVPPCI